MAAASKKYANSSKLIMRELQIHS